MVYHIDTFEPNQKRAYVISTTVLGVFFSTVTFGLRLLARRLVSKTLHHEDWWMLAGLITSYGIGAMSIWGAYCTGAPSQHCGPLTYGKAMLPLAASMKP